MDNGVAQIMDMTTAGCWSHVESDENPADCASRGLFPSELLRHDLWWNGPPWLKLPLTQWTKKEVHVARSTDNGELCNTACNLVITKDPLIPIDWFSSFDCYKRVTAWIMRFVHNCKEKAQGLQPKSGRLTTQELKYADNHLYSVIQAASFPNELRTLETKSQKLSTSSKIHSLNPIIDDTGIVRV